MLLKEKISLDYVVYCCSRDWAEVGQVPARETSYTVPHLAEGSEVAFRVRAVNAVGPSDPSRSTDTITVQDPPGTYYHSVFIAIRSFYLCYF